MRDLYASAEAIQVDLYLCLLYYNTESVYQGYPQHGKGSHGHYQRLFGCVPGSHVVQKEGVG